MDLTRNPELADRLAAAYALGSLRGGARRRFESMARQSPGLRAAALAWQERLAAMTELQPPEDPSPNVWKRIEIALRNERPAAMSSPQPQRAPWWRRAAFVGAFATVLVATLAGYLGTQLAQQDPGAEIRSLALLQDERSAPALLVTFDARAGTLVLRRLGSYREPADRSLQLWAVPASGSPRSLGVLDDGERITLPVSEGQLREIPLLAVTLEPRGGVPEGTPATGPILFKGPVLPAT